MLGTHCKYSISVKYVVTINDVISKIRSWEEVQAQ